MGEGHCQKDITLEGVSLAVTQHSLPNLKCDFGFTNLHVAEI